MWQADVLSRLLGSQTKMSEDTLVANIKVETEVQRLLNAAIGGLPVTFEDIKETTENGKTLR